MKHIESFVTASQSFSDFSRRYFERLSEILIAIPAGHLEAVVDEFAKARADDATIFVAGNGGSATTATSMANDLGFDILKKSGTDRPFRVLALTDSNAAITAIANDVGYENVFINQLKIHFREGDRLLAISASGNSPNVVEAATWVRSKGGRVISFLGFDGGRLLKLSDAYVLVKTEPGEYGPVEDAHLVVNHLLAHWYQVKLRGEP